jgi:hypothetical protein
MHTLSTVYLIIGDGLIFLRKVPCSFVLAK